MRFGLVITDERHGDAALALLEAARMRGWESRCFLNDRGVLLLTNPEFTGSDAFSATRVAVCELSIERYEEHGVQVTAIDPAVVIGGQYQDAELAHTCDHVLVL